jgi:hypothetical protein
MMMLSMLTGVTKHQHEVYSILSWKSGSSVLLCFIILVAVTLAYFVAAGIAFLRDACVSHINVSPDAPAELRWFGGSDPAANSPSDASAATLRQRKLRFSLDAPATGGGAEAPCMSFARAHPSLCILPPNPDGSAEYMPAAFTPRSLLPAPPAPRPLLPRLLPVLPPQPGGVAPASVRRLPPLAAGAVAGVAAAPLPARPLPAMISAAPPSTASPRRAPPVPPYVAQSPAASFRSTPGASSNSALGGLRYQPGYAIGQPAPAYGTLQPPSEVAVTYAAPLPMQR